MSSPWSSTVDRALRNTNATLERLQRAEVSYEQARTRVFPGERSPLQEHGVARSGRLDVPPPLPQSRYQTSMNAPAQADAGQGHVPARDDGFGLVDALQSQRLLQSQMQTVVAELALERVARTDSINDLRAQHQHHVSTLTSSITQLKEENAHLKRSVRALETRQAYQRGLHVGDQSGVAADGSRLPGQSLLTNASADGRTTYLGGGFGDATRMSAGEDALVDAKITFLNTSSSVAELKQRVTELEATVARQKQRLDTRHDRADGAVADLVKAQVAVEVEHVRSVAREAARDATEDLVKLRLNAIQSMFNAELQKVLESTGVSQEVAAATERQFHRMERDWEARLTRLESASATAQSQAHQLEKTREETAAAQADQRDELRAVRNEVTALKQQAQEDALRTAQLLNSKVDGSRADTMLAVTKLLDDRERHRLATAGTAVSEADVRRMLEAAVAPLHATLDQQRASTQRDRERAEATQQQCTRRLDELEAGQRASTEVSDSLRDAVERAEEDRRQLRSLAEAAQQSQRTTQSTCRDLSAATHDTAEALKQLSTEVEMHNAATGDAWRNFQKEQGVRLAESQRRQSENVEAVKTELADLATTVATLQQEQRRLVGPLAAKVDALRTCIDDTCVNPLEELALKVTSLAAQQKQLQDSKAYQEKLVAQQLSDLTAELGRRVSACEADARQYADRLQEGHSHVHDIVVQRIAQLERAVQSNVPQSAPLPALADVADQPALIALTARVSTLEQARLQERVLAPPPEAAGATAAESAQPLAIAAASREVEGLRGTVESLSGRLRTVEEAQEGLADKVRTLGEVVADTQHGLSQQDERQEEAQRRTIAAMQQQKTELRGYVERQETFFKEQIVALTEHVEELVKGAANISQTNTARLRESLAPQRLVAAFAADGEASTQLASLLEPHLSDNNETGKALLDLQVRLETVEAAQKPAAPEPTSAPDEVPAKACVVAALATRVAALEDSVAAAASVDRSAAPVPDATDRDADVAALTDAIRDAENRLQAHDEKLDVLMHTTESLAADHRTTAESQQKQLETLEEAVREANEAGLQPLRTKLQGVEESLAGSHEDLDRLRAQVTEMDKIGLERHELMRQDLSQFIATASKDRDALCTRLLDTVQERHKLLEGQLHAAEASQQADLATRTRDMNERLSRLEEQLGAALARAPDATGAQLAEILDPIDEQLQQLQTQIDTVFAMGDSDEQGLPPQARKSSNNGEPMHDNVMALSGLTERLAAVETSLAQLKESEDVGLQVTADALGSLSDSLQNCVERVRDELQRSQVWSSLVAADSSDVNTDELSGALGGDPSSSSQKQPIAALDDIFVFVVRQLHQIFHALSALQESAISSLEMIQQQEMDVLAVAPLQHAVLDLVARLEPVARAVGVDPATLQVDVGPLTEALEDVEDSEDRSGGASIEESGVVHAIPNEL